MPVRELPGDESAAYRAARRCTHGLDIEVQKVDHPSRVHLDIETDDIEAEVRRLEAMGAKKVEQVHSWWVMEAPTGQRFCVVKASRGISSGGRTRGNEQCNETFGHKTPSCCVLRHKYDGHFDIAHHYVIFKPISLDLRASGDTLVPSRVVALLSLVT